MDQYRLGAAAATMLSTLREHLVVPGTRSDTLGPIQATMLKGYLAEYVALNHDPVLERVLSEFPERPTLSDAVTVLEQILCGASPTAAPASGSRVSDASQASISPLGARLLAPIRRRRTEVRERSGPMESPTPSVLADPKPAAGQIDMKPATDQASQQATSADGQVAGDFEAERQIWVSTIPRLERVSSLALAVGLDDPMIPDPGRGMARFRRVIGVLTVGIVATLGAAAPLGFLSIPGWTGADWVKFFLFAFLYLFLYDIVGPLELRWASKGRVRRGLPPLVHRPLHPFHMRGLSGLLVGFVVSLAIEALVHISSDNANWLFFLAIVPLAGTVTWFWMAGTEAGRHQAALLGARSGVIAGCLLGFIISPTSSPFIIFQNILMSGLRGGLVGYAGGLALDRGWAGQPRGMLKALVAASLLWWLLVEPILGGQRDFFALLGGALTAAGFGAGWAIGVSDWHLRSPLQSLAFRQASSAEPWSGQGPG